MFFSRRKLKFAFSFRTKVFKAANIFTSLALVVLSDSFLLLEIFLIVQHSIPFASVPRFLQWVFLCRKIKTFRLGVKLKFSSDSSFHFQTFDCLGYYLCFLRLFRDKQEDSFFIQFFWNYFLKVSSNRLQLDALSCEIKSDILSRKPVIWGGLSLCFEEKRKYLVSVLLVATFSFLFPTQD